MKVAGIPHGLCSGCGETYLGIDEMEQLQKAAVDQAREAQGLLRPDEIRALRGALGDISQTRLEHLLGVGAKTVVRWEKGTVFQGATADRLMRLLRAMPELAGFLRAKSCTETSAWLGGDEARRAGPSVLRAVLGTVLGAGHDGVAPGV